MSKVALRMHSSLFVDETSTLCIWNPDVKLTTGDEMRDRIIGTLDPRPSSWIRSRLNRISVIPCDKFFGGATVCHHSSIADVRPGRLSSSARES